MDWLTKLKNRIRATQLHATVAVNSELVRLYWEIGREILEKQKEQGWGSKVIERIARDLRSTFPEMRGFSRTNLLYMRSFAAAWPDQAIVQQLVGQLPWGHNLVILSRVKNSQKREWYVIKAIENGWSRNILAMQIETKLYERQGKAVTNFHQRLPAPQSDLAQASLKDPYLFDFLGLGQEAHERAIETALIDHITSFLIELGSGFAYVGRQTHLEVGGDDFYVDLLFYHLKLRRYVAIELKTGPFRPEFAGQLNFYLSAIDAQIKTDHDNPSIGLLLCKEGNRLVAEYALRNIESPMGVAEYQLVQAIPSEFATSLPTVEEIESELQSRSSVPPDQAEKC